VVKGSLPTEVSKYFEVSTGRAFEARSSYVVKINDAAKFRSFLIADIRLAYILIFKLRAPRTTSRAKWRSS